MNRDERVYKQQILSRSTQLQNFGNNMPKRNFVSPWRNHQLRNVKSVSLSLSLSLSLQFNWLWVGTEKHSRSVCSPQRSLNRPTWLLCSAGRLSGRLFPRALFLRGRVAREQSRGHSQHAENCARAAASERGILPRSGNAEFLRDSGRFGGNATRWRTHTHTHTA